MDENAISGQIVDAAFKVHQALGPGLLESVYELALEHEIRKRGLSVQRQVEIAIQYDDLKFDIGFRADLIVESLVLVELKSLERLAAVHRKQLLSYVRLSGLRLGLLINFGEKLIKDGIERVANKMPE